MAVAEWVDGARLFSFPLNMETCLYDFAIVNLYSFNGQAKTQTSNLYIDIYRQLEIHSRIGCIILLKNVTEIASSMLILFWYKGRELNVDILYVSCGSTTKWKLSLHS